MPALPSALQPLRHSVYRRLWSAYVVVSLGGWMQNTGAGWLMTSLQPDALTVSLVQAATILPVFMLALPAGALADLVERRRYMIGVQFLMLLVAVGLAGVTYAHWITATSLLLFTFAIGVGTAMGGPAWGTIVTEVVPRPDLAQAIALNGVGFNLARAIGPAIAGFVVALGGAAMTFLLNAVSFLAVVTVLLSWRRPREVNKLPREHFLSAMRNGVRFVRNTPAVRAAMLRIAGYYLPTAGPWAMLPLVVREQLHLGPGAFGLLLAAMGVGGVASGLLLPQLHGRLSRGRIMLACSLMSCSGMALLSVARHWSIAVLAMVIFGLGWVAASSTTQAATQLASPTWVRARALAIYQFASNGSLFLGSFLWGWVGTRMSVSSTLAIAAAVGVGLAFAALPWTLEAPIVREKTPAPPAPPSPPEAPAPELAPWLTSTRGQLLEMVRYTVSPAARQNFLEAMAEIRLVRGRCGAVMWQLYEDVAHPEGWLELWTMENWTDHLREATRLAPEDLAALAALAVYQPHSATPQTSRFIAVETPRPHLLRNVA
jgi:MFS family permease